MARAFLHNAQVTEANANTEKWKLVITSQMFGSGKTALGKNFMSAIGRYESQLRTSRSLFFFWLS